jgi:hypothetical protein
MYWDGWVKISKLKNKNIYNNTNKYEADIAPHANKPDGTYNMKF